MDDVAIKKPARSDAGITATYNGAAHMPLEDIGLMRLVPSCWSNVPGSRI